MKYNILRLCALLTFTISHAQTSLHFDGNNDYVNLNSISSTMDTVSEFTLDFWVKFDLANNTDYGAFFAVNTVNHDNVFLIRVANGNFDPVNDGAIVYINDNGNQYMSGSSPIGDGLCHHIAFTYDNTACKLYIDGVLEASANHTITFNSTDLYSLGQEYDGGTIPISNLFEGELDELRIWSEAKNQPDIANLMTLVPNANTAHLMHYFKLDDGLPNANNTSISTITNEVNTAANGLLNNFSLTGNVSNYITNTCNSSYYVLSIDTQLCNGPYLSMFGEYYTESGVYVDTFFSADEDTILQLALEITSENIQTAVSQNTIGTLISLDSISTYQWLFCEENYAVIPGETNQIFTPSNSGYYAVELTLNGCIDTSECILTKGIGLEEEQNLFSFYPNPSHGQITILGLKENTMYTIHILSQIGTVLESKSGLNLHNEIQLPYEKGYYIIQILDRTTGRESQLPVIIH